MKRLLAVALIVAALAVALELFLRGGGRTALLDPADLFAPDRRGWCGGAWVETDEQGQRAPPRRGSGATAAARAIHVVGGRFTAGAGLAVDELYPARLEPRARAGGFEEVVVVAVPEQKPAAVRRLLPELKRDEVLVIEVDGGDLGGDPTPFSIAAPARSLSPVEPSTIAIVNWGRLLAQRRARAAAESEISELVLRDGFTGRATARAKLRLESITRAAAEKRLAPESTRLLRAWIAERYGLQRAETRAARLEEWRALFEELRRGQKIGILLVVGPTPPTVDLAQAARDYAVAVVHAPPFELDPDLRIDAPWPRPAASVHAQVADSLFAELTKRGLLTGSAAAPDRVISHADAIEQQFLSSGGFYDAFVALAKAQLDKSITFPAGDPPPNVLRGLGPNGRLDVATPGELVLRRPSFPTALIVRADAPIGSAPRLLLRHSIGRAVADPQPLDAAPSRPGRPGHVLLEWRFDPPAARTPLDFTPLEFTLQPAPGGGVSVSSVELREVRFTEQHGD